jgi:thioredoxin 1
LDIDRNPAYAQMYNVQSVPTLIIFQRGKIIWRKSGVTPAQEILQHVRECLVV